MDNRKTHNSIFILATLGVYLGLVLVLAAPRALAQERDGSSIEINKRPLKDLGNSIRKKLESKEVDLNAPFLIELSGAVKPNGKLDVSSVKYTRVEGDTEILGIAKETIEAVNDSGFFQYLRALKISEFTVRLRQDESQFTCQLTASLESETQARSDASAMNAYLAILRSQKESSGGLQNGNSDLVIIKGARAVTDAKTLVLSLDLPKTVLREMIDRELAKR